MSGAIGVSKRQIRAQQQMQREQERERQQRQLEGAALENAMQQGPEGKAGAEWLDGLTETNLQAATQKHIRNLLSKDFVLGKISGAEKDELKWLARNVALRVKSIHPPEESVFQGEYRKVVFDDKEAGERALTDSQIEEIRHIVLAFFVRESRSEGGWQQEEMGRFYAVSERREPDDKGRLDGLFPGGR